MSLLSIDNQVEGKQSVLIPLSGQGIVSSQELTRVVLPNPAGATTIVSSLVGFALSISTKPGRTNKLPGG